jgi:hypothetical protein
MLSLKIEYLKYSVNPWVEGSNPSGVTRNALIKQLEVQIIIFDHSVCEDRVVSF